MQTDIVVTRNCISHSCYRTLLVHFSYNLFFSVVIGNSVYCQVDWSSLLLNLTDSVTLGGAYDADGTSPV